jgi:hypothetical protein
LRAYAEAQRQAFVDLLGEMLGRFTPSEGAACVVAAHVCHAAAEYGKGSDDTLEEPASAFWIGLKHGMTVGLLGARVVRRMKILRYGFVATEAESSGGALRVWKTTQ